MDIQCIKRKSSIGMQNTNWYWEISSIQLKKIKILKYQKFIRTGFTDNLIETGIIHWMHILQGARRKTAQYGEIANSPYLQLQIKIL